MEAALETAKGWVARHHEIDREIAVITEEMERSRAEREATALDVAPPEPPPRTVSGLGLQRRVSAAI